MVNPSKIKKNAVKRYDERPPADIKMGIILGHKAFFRLALHPAIAEKATGRNHVSGVCISSCQACKRKLWVGLLRHTVPRCRIPGMSETELDPSDKRPTCLQFARGSDGYRSLPFAPLQSFVSRHAAIKGRRLECVR